MRAGLGRARMHERAFGLAGLEELVLAAAVRCPVLDEQVEGLESRADWIAGMVERGELVPQVLAAIRAAVREGAWRADSWDARWQAEVLACLQPVDALAGELLRAGFEDSGAEQVGAGPLVRAFGAAGLGFVARSLGRRLRSEPGFDLPFGPNEDALLELDERQGEGAALGLLEALAGSDADAGAYLKRVRAAHGSEDGSRPRAERPSVAEVPGLVERSGSGLFLLRWARRFTQAERLALFEAAHRAASDRRRAALLCAFVHGGPPYVSQGLLDWCRAGGELGWRATRLLGAVRDPRARRLALERLRCEQPDWAALALLRSNYRAGDAGWLLERLERAAWDDRHEAHDVLRDLLAIGEESAARDVERLLVPVFAGTHCGLCRHSALGRLLELGRAPGWMVDEARLDGNADVRALAASVYGST